MKNLKQFSDEELKLIRDYTEQKERTAAARAHGFTTEYVYKILRGERNITPKIAPVMQQLLKKAKTNKTKRDVAEFK